MEFHYANELHFNDLFLDFETATIENWIWACSNDNELYPPPPFSVLPPTWFEYPRFFLSARKISHHSLTQNCPSSYADMNYVQFQSFKASVVVV